MSKKIDPHMRAFGNMAAPGGMASLGGPGFGPLGGGPGGPPGGKEQEKPKRVPGKAEGRVWGYSGPGDWLGQAPVVEKWDREVECDVVVVGSGNAGVQAALAAAEKGADVCVLEKQTEDLFTWLGEDIAAYNAKFCTDQGFGPYDLGEIVDEFVVRTGGRVDPEIVRLFVHNAGPTVDHMLEIAKEMGGDPRAYTYDPTPDGWVHIQANMDYDKIMAGEDIYKCFNYNYPMHPGTKTWAATVQFMGEYNPEPIMGIAANSVLPMINQACIDKAETLGARWYWGNEGIVLIKNEAGAVIGVFAKDVESGAITRFHARKGVIVAGGGYAANKEMCWALLPEYMERAERAGGTIDRFSSMFGGRMGEGIKLMCWAGGFVEPAPRGTMLLGGGPVGPWGANSMLWLNCRGKRFANEGNVTGAQTACSRQPNGLGCLVTDKKWLKSVCASGLEHSGPNAGRPQYYLDMIEGMEKIASGPEGGLVKDCTISERGYKRVIRAESLEELAGYLGYDEKTIPTFLASIAHYNELCYAGRDTDFGKDPSAMIPIDEAPFYGVTTELGSDERIGPQMVTMSGCMTDTRLNVIDLNKDPIPGLYTCGNSMGGRYGTGYCTPSAGTSIGYAVTHGRLAGQFVCEEADK